jgi:hypothetical protein
MPRIAVAMLAAVAVLLVGSQLAIPPLAERQARDRLERGGGRAEVSMSAFPALRLLAGDGRSLDVRGEGLRFDLGGKREGLERLDGFGRVRVALDRSAAGPLMLTGLRLARDPGDRAYRLRVKARTTPRELAGYLGSWAAGELGSRVGEFGAAQLPGGGAADMPLELDASLESRDGRVAVTAASGAVAGIPAGPLAELVMTAVARRL